MEEKSRHAEKKEQGLVLLHTGDGKGKSTAAFGQALRALGHGLRVCIVQFIKSSQNTGEAKAFASFKDTVEFHVRGSGFTWKTKDKEEAVKAARDAFAFARDKVLSDKYDMVVLDELTYLITYGMVPENDVLDLIQKRPPRLHLVITGRNASEGLVAAADLVSEVRLVKHPFEKGGKARMGIEF
ncbi:MAG: cob(I)yrinic acid a,c-diamide adenosyltransferase [Desulfobulbaceae bacterium]|nr:cob(I)yrinic acid a,c-diamide adenosyltransferase [Desulfobulbaceae bacterium]